MKRLLLFLVASLSLHAQNKGKVETTVDQLKSTGTVFTQQNLVTNYGADSRNTSNVANASLLEIDFSAIQQLLQNQTEFIRINIPYQNQILELALYKVAIKTNDFEVNTPQGTFTSGQQSAHYRGIVNGLNRSLVSFNVYPNQINGIISTLQHGNLNFGKLKTASDTFTHIIYSDRNLKRVNEFLCSSKEETTTITASTTATATTDRCVTNYFEVDHAIYLENESNLEDTIAWMESLFNNVQTIFDNDEINTAIKSIFVWTTPDPYTGDSSFDYLFSFFENRPFFNGDVGMLVGVDEGGLGGVAATINGLCNGSKYSYSDVDIFFGDVPVYSWPVNVVTHELGHLFGSQHTHGCYWNGNDTAIDGCGPEFSEVFAEGDCDFAEVPAVGVGGTIMSYCHLLPEVGVNFVNGFGPQPAARMQSTINNADCLSTDCINTCITLISDVFAENVSQNSAFVTWNDQNVGASYQISTGVFPATENQLSFSPVATTQATVSGLNPNTFYNFFVKPACPENLTATSAFTTFATAANWCEGPIVITDSGGLLGEYGNGENWIRQIIPSIVGAKITIEFEEFSIEEGWDFLSIYNGTFPGPNATLIGEFTGSDILPEITSTAEDGALTLVFNSDSFISDFGFIGSVSCLTLGTGENQFLDLQYYPNPTNDLLTVRASMEIEKIEIYSMDGRKVLEQDNSTSMIEISTELLANGSYLAKVIGQENQTTFKFVKQ